MSASLLSKGSQEAALRPSNLTTTRFCSDHTHTQSIEVQVREVGQDWLSRENATWLVLRADQAIRRTL